MTAPDREEAARARRADAAHLAMATKIILDVDTGTDDAVALMVAALSPDLELVGATDRQRQHRLDNCTENTLRVFDWIGMPGVPVHRGMSPAARPRAADQLNPATRIHGDLLDLRRRRSRAQPGTRSTGSSTPISPRTATSRSSRSVR